MPERYGVDIVPAHQWMSCAIRTVKIEFLLEQLIDE